MKKVGLGQRLRYEFDKSMAAGPIALIGWLALVSLLVILVAGAVVAVFGIAPDGADQPLGFVEGSWDAMMRTFDPGTMGGDQGWGFRLVMLVVTLAGIFIVSTLIGILSAGIEGKLGQLRKGRSLVLESDHTIIYNWSASIFDVIGELVVANESRRRPRIVVLATRDKVEMEDEIADKVPNLKNTRIICRSGDPTDLHDIALANPQASRSIIILSPEDDDPDSQVIKTVLALINDPGRREEKYRIAAEMRDARNADVARVVGGEEIQLVLADDLIGRIVVQSCRQSGLSAVYTELLDFDGCEIYTTGQPELIGKTFGEAVTAYDTSTVIGLCHPDNRVELQPAYDTVIAAGMRIALIAEDDSAIKLDGQAQRIAPPATPAPPLARRAERTLVLGWNRRGAIIADELSRYVGPGSLLTVAADTPGVEAEVASLELAGKDLAVEFRRVDTSARSQIAALEPNSYDQVLVLGYSATMPAQAADTRTLVTLLHLRNLTDADGSPDHHPKVVSEMIDVRNRELAEVTRADDFVVSNKLVSLMLAQASENEYLEAIFRDLLDEEGSEICLRPIEDYAPVGTPATYGQVVLAAAHRGEVAIGHHLPRASVDDGRNLGGIIVNPTKSAAVTYQAGDRVIVLATG